MLSRVVWKQDKYLKCFEWTQGRCDIVKICCFFGCLHNDKTLWEQMCHCQLVVGELIPDWLYKTHCLCLCSAFDMESYVHVWFIFILCICWGLAFHKEIIHFWEVIMGARLWLLCQFSWGFIIVEAARLRPFGGKLKFVWPVFLRNGAGTFRGNLSGEESVTWLPDSGGRRRVQKPPAPTRGQVACEEAARGGRRVGRGVWRKLATTLGSSFTRRWD